MSTKTRTVAPCAAQAASIALSWADARDIAELPSMITRDEVVSLAEHIDDTARTVDEIPDALKAYGRLHEGTPRSRYAGDIIALAEMVATYRKIDPTTCADLSGVMMAARQLDPVAAVFADIIARKIAIRPSVATID